MMFYKVDNLDYNHNGFILPPHFLLLQKQPLQLHHTKASYLLPNVDDAIIFSPRENV